MRIGGGEVCQVGRGSGGGGWGGVGPMVVGVAGGGHRPTRPRRR